MCFKFHFLVILLLPLSVFAQDFASLSAKERIAAAEREEVDAAQDGVYMQTMQQGHELFKDRHYLEAIHKYEAAREQRPLNVYPKVIIADIELSMKDTLTVLRAAEKQVKEKEATQISEPKMAETPSPKPIDIPKETPQERIDKVNEWEANERKRLEAERKRKSEEKAPIAETATGDVPVMSVAEYQKELGQRYPNGTTEEVFTEGNKTITKRVVVSDGTGNEYKKVVHNWGGVFFFKNGESVTERVWTQETQ